MLAVKRTVAAKPSLKDKRRSIKHKAATREIFFAAARAINNNHTTSLAGVAEQLGGTRGTIYYYFKTKGEMLYKMEHYLHDQIAHTLEPIFNNSNLSAMQKLKRIIYNYTLVELEHYELVRALWTDASLYEQPLKLREMTMQRVDNFYRQIEILIAEACEAENLRIINVKAAARIIFSIPDTICRWYQPEAGKLSAKQIAEYLTVTVFWGFFMPDTRILRPNYR